ncbi:serpin-ZX-like [Bidens hawaiensis]|uniref:serpin-ZX-like n=1 Tax=Bidens hawaiensis TaxID=980011 RepID=UPI00404B1670
MISDKQIISNQTHVSTILAAHLFSKKHNSNVVFSPVSIHVVLSLMAAGSKGPTLDQLLAFLKTNTTKELNSLYSHTVSWILEDGSLNGGPRLAFANGVWIDKTCSLKPSFKQVVDNVYEAACERVDFQNMAVEVANKVNSWAEKQTNGLIKDVIDANSVNKFTKLIFANAVYFKGAWSEKFDESLTEESEFHLLNGNQVQVPFMTNEEDRLFVCEFDDFKVLGLPYSKDEDEQEDRQFTMYVFLPDAEDGLQSLVEKISSTSDFIDCHIPQKKERVGEFLLPKFKISNAFEASSMLKDLGRVLPFTDECDLTEVADSSAGESLYVSSIHHKSFVEVCEEGTEAAAHSIMLMTRCARGSSEKPKRIDFVADHPFLFVIREDETGVVLFVGQVVDPRGS